MRKANPGGLANVVLTKVRGPAVIVEPLVAADCVARARQMRGARQAPGPCVRVEERNVIDAVAPPLAGRADGG